MYYLSSPGSLSRFNYLNSCAKSRRPSPPCFFFLRGFGEFMIVVQIFRERSGIDVCMHIFQKNS
jgi:hypothetical protein